jgi:hypothetical protein
VKHPVPSRTRKLSTIAPMVLRLKAWESRSPPILVNQTSLYRDLICIIGTFAFLLALGAGWSSPVARQAHNLKVVGSNPTPATIRHESPAVNSAGLSCFISIFAMSHLIHRATDLSPKFPPSLHGVLGVNALAPILGPPGSRYCRLSSDWWAGITV